MSTITTNNKNKDFIDSVAFLDDNISMVYDPNYIFGDFRKLRDYCLKNNVDPSRLTTEEMNKFGFSY